ncbi:3-hydroxyacyl-CoA dehydrogenase/enoyl-CoA hydratase family protein [Carboxydothermus islandicus]|uniref:3-hydroxyacyl-CoA dehydrogenase/enoyl-CoA hydratase family protein n=1 Tax=Carboxydothermus islandicus TaxID=661089 RepID=UPI00096A805F|nr:3-hydroxyacyl-CoA dehydrogenase/enoyl-CoA hydratase family protein [Carboxydothermus islandicus]
MVYKINKVGVIGSGIMGSGIAALLTNAGIPVVLLDIVPFSLTPEEEKKGLTLESPEVRYRIVRGGLEAAKKASPAAFAVPENADLITIGNLEDDLHLLQDCDWVVEVVVENLEIKKNLFTKIAPYLKPTAIISTNTSGISVNKMVEHMPKEFRERFLGTHFFNPPRYMKLLEIIPGNDTKPEIVDFMAKFGERVLGKGIVFAKDTPNFIGNRIGVYGILETMKALEEGYTVEAVDALTGPVLGRPNSATFRTADLVGLDTLVHVAKNVYDNISDPAEKEFFRVPEFLEKMVANKLLGDKTGAGFYKKVKTDAGKEILSLDVKTLQYKPQEKVNYPSLEAAKAAEGLKAKLQTLISGKDEGAALVWRIMKKTLLYAASKIPEIADDIVNIDRAMRWGFNWQLGPFETWDAIGVEKTVARMREEGEVIPPIVEKLLAKGYKSFYKYENGVTYYFDLATEDYKPIVLPKEFYVIKDLKAQNKVIFENQGASLIDIGDDVALLEFHSKSNSIGDDVLSMIRRATEEVSRNWRGLVIGNDGKNFSVGANLALILMTIEDEDWDELDYMVKTFQDSLLTLKYCDKPVVAAPFGMTLGGGCELCLASDGIQAAAETYMGLVEVGVGLVPAGGGLKELVYRMSEYANDTSGWRVAGAVDYKPFIFRAFELAATARVSTSGQEAKKLGFLRPCDGVTMNRDYLIHDAKERVLHMSRMGYRPPVPKPVKVLGTSGYAALASVIHNMKEGNFISEYDAHIAKKIAYVLTGGNVHPGTYVTEQYLLDLEREAFLSLAGERKTQERIRHMLLKNKPLRN